MTHAEFIDLIIYGVRTGQIVAWLDSSGEIRLSNADKATAAQWRVALRPEAVMVLASCNNGCEFRKNS